MLRNIKSSPKTVAIAGIIFLISIPILCCCCVIIFGALLPPTPKEDNRSNDVKGTSVKQATEPEQKEVIETYQVKNITDGDTIKIEYKGKIEPVRLLGIDSPETGDCYSSESTGKLTELVKDKSIRVEFDTIQGQRDKYDRLLFYIWVEGPDNKETFVNEYLVKEGYSIAYTKINSKYLEQFTKLEEEATTSKKGLWGDTCKCADKKDEEESRQCSVCNKAKVNYYNWDCTTYSKEVEDTTCSSSCPKVEESTPKYTPPQTLFRSCCFFF